MRFRSGNADLAKFIASCLIMTYHIFIFGLRNYHFGTAWIYVEFFLIITGFFTARHFSTVKTEEPMKIAIRYTINKFLPLIPYTTIATVLMYLLLLVPLLVNGQLNFEEFLLSFTTDMPFDLLIFFMYFSYITDNSNKNDPTARPAIMRRKAFAHSPLIPK